MKRSIYTMIQHIQSDLFILDETVSIAEASQAALSRPLESVFEPVLVSYSSGEYCVLDLHVLLLGQSQVLESVNQVVVRQKEIEETLRVASAELSTSFNVQRIIQVLLKYIAKFINFDSAHVFMYEDGNFWLRGSDGSETENRQDSLFAGQENKVFWEIMQTHASVIISDSKKFPSRKIGGFLKRSIV